MSNHRIGWSGNQHNHDRAGFKVELVFFLLHLVTILMKTTCTKTGWWRLHMTESWVRTTCSVISFVAKWLFNLPTVYPSIWSCYLLNDVLGPSITSESLHFLLYAKLNIQYSRNTTNSFGQFVSSTGRSLILSACLWFPHWQRDNTPCYLNTNSLLKPRLAD